MEISLEAIQEQEITNKHNCLPEIVLIKSPLPICNICHKTNLWLLTPKHTHLPEFKSTATIAKTMWSCLIDYNCLSNKLNVVISHQRSRSRVSPHTPSTDRRYLFSLHRWVTMLAWCPLVCTKLCLTIAHIIDIK